METERTQRVDYKSIRAIIKEKLLCFSVLNRRVGMLQVLPLEEKGKKMYRDNQLWPGKAMLTAGENPSGNKQPKKIVIITARSEPWHSSSNFCLRGFMEDFLSQNSILAGHTRKSVTLLVIPVLSTDGMILGNSKCGVTGQTLTDCLSIECRAICPEIHYLRRLINKLKAEGNEILATVHLESTREGRGCSMRAPLETGVPKEVVQKMMLPSLMHENEQNFDLSSCV